MSFTTRRKPQTITSLPLLCELAVLLHEVVLHCGEIQEQGEGTHPQTLQCWQQHGQAAVSIYRLFTELMWHLYAPEACNDAQTVPTAGVIKQVSQQKSGFV